LINKRGWNSGKPTNTDAPGFLFGSVFCLSIIDGIVMKRFFTNPSKIMMGTIGHGPLGNIAKQ